MAEINSEFLKFVKSKKSKAIPDDDIYTRVNNNPFNNKADGNGIANFIKTKAKEDNDNSIANLLKEFSGKVIETKSVVVNKIDNDVSDEEESENVSLSLSEESDYEVEKINHFVRKDRNPQNELEELFNIQKSYPIKNKEKWHEKNKKPLPKIPEKKNLPSEKKFPDKRNMAENKFPDKKNMVEKKSSQYILSTKNKPQPTPNRKIPNLPNSSHTAFLGNLPLSATQEQIKKQFNNIGKVLTVRLKTTKDGKSKGFGYIDFSSEKCLNKAIDNTNKILMDGKEVKIEKAKSSFNDSFYHESNIRLGKKKKRIAQNKKN
jgi:hypothetical protein